MLLLSIVDLVKFEDICLNTIVLTCSRNDQIEKIYNNIISDTNDSFVDGSSFPFVNFTRLTSSTLTNFTSTFFV